MPIAVTAEQVAIADSVAQWAKRACTIAAVRRLEATGGQAAGGAEGDGLAPAGSGAWSAAARARLGEHWSDVADLGIFSIALPEDLGGAGGTVADVAVVAEQLAVALAPGPLLPTLLAGLVLARCGQQRDGDVRALLGEIATGDAAVAVALTAGGLSRTATATGGLRVSGTARLVLGAGDARWLLLAAQTSPEGVAPPPGPEGPGPAADPEPPGSAPSPEGPGPAAAPDGLVWFLANAAQPGVVVTPRSPVDFSRPLADVTLTAVTVPAARVLGAADPRLVPDLAAALAAAEASGVAAWCSQTATEYARTRQQFGRPIGSFQAIKHLCAQMVCRAELAAAAAWDAACAADQAPGELALAAAAAAGLTLDAAVDNAKDCIQVLGGIGFTWEHDAHLYLRRALALRSLLGGSAAWRARAASLALGGARRHPFEPEPFSGDHSPSDADEVRAAARLVASAVSATPRDHWREGLAEIGYAAPAWPPPYGLAATPATQLIIDEELATAGIERPDLAIGAWAIPAIISHGTAEQLSRFGWPTLTGEITWCQLFSEPEAGSDLASLRTRAIRVSGDGEADAGWRLTGQKVWTSLAAEADWAICLARTDPAAPKHKGITFFLVSMREPGIDVRPLREITGREMFNEVFLDDVFVPDECVVGQPGEGWRVARTTLATERVAMVRGAGLGEDAEELLAAAAADGGVSDPAVIDQIGARLAESLALSVMDDRIAGAAVRDTAARGAGAGQAAAVRKLLGVAHRQAVAETAVTLAGVQGAAADGRAADAVDSFLLTRCLSIAGGTSQILLSLVAERVLGLPREETR